MMKKLLLLLIAAAIAVSCDSEYDLSKANVDDITIGGDESEFRIPLATLIVRLDQLKGDAGDIKAMFDEVNVWLPSDLPDGDFVYIDKLIDPSTGYLDDILDRLFVEMNDESSPKIDAVAKLIWNNPAYREKFTKIIPDVVDDITEEEFIDLFRQYFRNSNQIGDQFREITSDISHQYLGDLKIESVKYTVGQIDLGEDVVNMLVDNLDPKDTPNPKNALYLYGNVLSGLPVSIQTSPVFVGTDIHISPIMINPTAVNPISETRIYADDFRKVIAGLEIDVPIDLEKYYPAIGFDDNQKIEMILRLRKTGGLTVTL